MKKIMKKIMGIPTEYSEGEYLVAYSKLSDGIEKSNKKAVDRIEFFMIESEEIIFELANKIGKGIPIVINFESIDVKVANKIITFLSGCLYAIDGEVIEIKNKIYMFASKYNLLDGTLEEFVKEYN